MSSASEQNHTGFLALLRTEFKRQSPLLILTGSYYLGILIVGAFLGVLSEILTPLDLRPFISVSFYILVIGLWILAFETLRKDPLRDFPDAFIARIRFQERIAAAIPALLALYPMMLVFGNIKSLVPRIVPYSWDPVFAEADHLLHLGVYPHEILAVFLNDPYVTYAIDKFYFAWFFFVFIIMNLMVFVVFKPALRLQYFLAFMLCWVILGNICATIFSSVGPIFYADFFPGLPNPYAELTAHLHKVSEDDKMFLMTLDAADFLLQMAKDGNVVNLNGISAMPSLHIAQATLMVLVTWRMSRILGGVFFLVFLTTLAGSVHLGWHYAVDGYVGALGAIVMWVLSGRFVRFWLDPETVQDPPEDRPDLPAPRTDG